MKKTYLSVALVIALATSMLTSSCIGSFSLFGKMRDWNEQVGDKFINELVFIAFWIVPVYEVAFMADFFVINSIEFERQQPRGIGQESHRRQGRPLPRRV